MSDTNSTSAHLTNDELNVIYMALHSFIENMSADMQDLTKPYTPEARNSGREIIATAQSAEGKIISLIGHEGRIRPYESGDEDEFYTKQS